MTIKNKLIISISLVSVLVFSGFAVFNLHYIQKMENLLQAGLEREGINLIQATAEATNLTLPSRDYNLVDTYADAVVAKYDHLMEFSIYDENGDIIYDYSRRDKVPDSAASSNLSFFDNPIDHVRTRITENECEFIGALKFHNTPQKQMNEPFGYVRLVFWKGDIHTTVHQSLFNSIIFFLILLVIILSGLYLGVHQLVIKPIRLLSKSIHRIQSGDRNHRVVLDTHDEFAILADAFNHMITNLNILMEKECDVAKERATAQVAREKARELAQAYQQQKQLNSQLQRAKENLQRLLDSMPVGIILSSPDGLIQHVNSTALRMSGYNEPQEIIGKLTPKQLLYWPEEREHHPGEHYERLLKTRNRQEIPVLVTRTTLNLDDKEIALRAFIDITEHKKDQETRLMLEKELSHTRRLEAIGTLAAGVAHEINTPMQFIGSNSQFVGEAIEELLETINSFCNLFQDISNDASLPDILANAQEISKNVDLEYYRQEIPRAMQDNQEGIQRVADIVAAMKDFSHMSSSEKRPEDLNKAVNSTVILSRNEWKYIADLDTNLAPVLPSVECTVGDIKQALLNLIVNAAHAIETKIKQTGEEKGRITITSGMKDDQVIIAVADTGTGIPSDIQDRVFEPFFTTKDVGKGTGQGLALVYQAIVEKHGGKVWFETKSGQGTTFFIQLPLNASKPVEHNN
ncbi:MAG: HAMP domain-containing protein [Sedimentisphaerales bacterium]|nr:HAMP domain-containing protein [Sedimentisphaerales bacterium]